MSAEQEAMPMIGTGDPCPECGEPIMSIRVNSWINVNRPDEIVIESCGHRFTRVGG